jgi:hypothetical protein
MQMPGAALAEATDLDISLVTSLDSLDKAYTHTRCEMWVFPIGLAAPPPPGISKDVDVRTKAVQTSAAQRHGLQDNVAIDTVVLVYCQSTSITAFWFQANLNSNAFFCSVKSLQGSRQVMCSQWTFLPPNGDAVARESPALACTCSAASSSRLTAVL